MNYYEHHLGDYAKDTAHLSLLEHGAYRILLDRYYATEEGIPADQAHRLARARTDEEKAAVDAVLAEFFTPVEKPTGLAWVNGRAEEEIQKATARIKAAQENGKRGGRPPKTGEKKPTGLIPLNPNITQVKAYQAPYTSIKNNIVPSESPPPQTAPQKSKRLCQGKVALPSDFGISDAVREWAAEKGYGQLERHLEHFIGSAQAKGYIYADWDAAFKNAIRNNWAKIPATAATNGMNAKVVF